MKNVVGGKPQTFECFAVTSTGGQGGSIYFSADNVDAAQGLADYYANQSAFTQQFPYGIDCPGAE